MSGVLVEEAGFGVGSQVSVTIEQNQLSIKRIEEGVITLSPASLGFLYQRNLAGLNKVNINKETFLQVAWQYPKSLWFILGFLKDWPALFPTGASRAACTFMMF